MREFGSTFRAEVVFPAASWDLGKTAYLGGNRREFERRRIAIGDSHLWQLATFDSSLRDFGCWPKPDRVVILVTVRRKRLNPPIIRILI
jgi:hypothetical protein